MSYRATLIAAMLAALAASSFAQQIDINGPDKELTVTGEAAGVDVAAKDEAAAAALRKAVEQACGVFLTAKSKAEDYKITYDKVFANAVGYVKEHKVLKTEQAGGVTRVTVRALVSTQKFEKDWAVIAHTVNQEGNPRVIIAIAETTIWSTTGPIYRVEEAGSIQGKVEDFFLSKGIQLMDRATAVSVSRRDILLAVIKDDTREVAALGARFHADVVIIGQASAKFGKEITVGEQRMYQYVANMTVRAIQTDSARILVSKTYGPDTCNSLQKGGGEEKALAKMGDESAPKLLAAVVEAWRNRANVQRVVQLTISGLDFDGWKTFKAEAEKIQGVQALRLRDITEGIANIDVEYRYTNELLAERLSGMTTVKLSVTELSANRLKLKVKP